MSLLNISGLISCSLKKRKKVYEKLHVIHKIVVPLQRFNKQLIVLQLKNKRKMKKLAFMFAVVAAVSFASCGQKTEKGSCCESDTVAVEEVACCGDDSCCNDSCCADTVTCPVAE